MSFDHRQLQLCTPDCNRYQHSFGSFRWTFIFHCDFWSSCLLIAIIDHIAEQIQYLKGKFMIDQILYALSIQYLNIYTFGRIYVDLLFSHLFHSNVLDTQINWDSFSVYQSLFTLNDSFIIISFVNTATWKFFCSTKYVYVMGINAFLFCHNLFIFLCKVIEIKLNLFIFEKWTSYSFFVWLFELHPHCKLHSTSFSIHNFHVFFF